MTIRIDYNPRGGYIVACDDCGWSPGTTPSLYKNAAVVEVHLRTCEGTPRRRPAKAPAGTGRTNLTADDVRHIRAQHANGATQVDLAERFGVTTSTVNYIVKRKTWAHVD
jgi:ribosome-binding protein aMBF1 (putative translation factor)